MLEELPKRLIYLRKKQDVKQWEIAKYLGISRPAYTNYEQGTRNPDNIMLLKIAKYYNTSTDFLLGQTDNEQTNKKIDLSNENLKFIYRGRELTTSELLSFLPPEFVDSHKIEAWVDGANLGSQTKKEIIEILKKHGYIE